MQPTDARPPEPEEPFGERLREAALEAELETGRVEESVAEARAHIVVRLGRMSLGFTLLVLGAAMLVLPGPGWLLIAIGLGILSIDFAWADRLLGHVKRRIPGVQEDGKIPRSAIVTMVLLALAFGAASIWWMTR